MSEWHPMETAPHDEEILAAIFVRNINTRQSWWERRVIVIDGETGRITDMDFDHGWDACDYSHWMPCPPPPGEPT